MNANLFISIKSGALLLMLAFNFSLSAQFSADSLFHIEVQGNDTDSFITFDGAKKNQVFYNSTSQIRNALLIHLVGSFGNPNSTILYPTEAANNGFHCINLVYRNGVTAQTACADVPDSNCHLNFRKEIIEGIDYSPEINVNSANSIDNRLLKLLQYLHANYPSQNWSQYYTGNSILWEKLIVSGHSQGGGHAAVIGITRPVQRVLMFASPNDYSDTLNILAPWTELPHLASDSNYYSFNALHDEVGEFWKQLAHSDALGLDNYGDTVDVDDVSSPFNNSRKLYTEEIVSTPNPLELTHNVMIRDVETPLDVSGYPIFACVWRYMLGIECPLASIGESLQNLHFSVYPNPASDKIHIELDQYQSVQLNAVIVDVYGREKVSIQIISDHKNEIIVRNFENGMYFVQLYDGNELIRSQRFIVK